MRLRVSEFGWHLLVGPNVILPYRLHPKSRQMKKLSHILAIVALCCFAREVSSQQGSYVLGFESWGGYTTNGTLPFWLRSNQYGSVPLDGASLSLVGFARKDYVPGKEKLFDWGASFEGRANLGQGSNLTLIEGYGKVRLGIFELRAGRSKKITGLCDSTLSSGSWAISGNNLGIPEVELSVRDFCTLPWFGGLFAFKGNFSHGWMGDVQMQREYTSRDTVLLNAFLHQKSLYIKLGKPEWRLKLLGGFNHQTIWGSEQEYYHEDFILSPFKTYLYVLTGKKYNNGLIREVRLGDHLGSVDIGLEYHFENFKILFYRQNFYDAGALVHLANIQDGLNGFSFENEIETTKKVILKRMNFEFLYSKNQAGEPWSPPTGSPYEAYYNHSQYINGWSYKEVGIGSPLIGSRVYIREDLPGDPLDYFINNRVIAFHVGLEGSVKKINCLLKATWSRNYGTYRTSDENQTTGIPDPGSYGLFGVQSQFSTIFQLSRNISHNVGISLIGAADTGELYYNSTGLFLTFLYKFTK